MKTLLQLPLYSAPGRMIEMAFNAYPGTWYSRQDSQSLKRVFWEGVHCFGLRWLVERRGGHSILACGVVRKPCLALFWISMTRGLSQLGLGWLLDTPLGQISMPKKIYPELFFVTERPDALAIICSTLSRILVSEHFFSICSFDQRRPSSEPVSHLSQGRYHMLLLQRS